MEGDVGGLGVFEGVGDGFLRDHAEVMRDGRRDGRDGTEIKGDGDVLGGTRGQELQSLGQGGTRGVVAEIGDEVAGFALNAGDEAAAGFEQSAGFFLERSGARGIEPEGEAGEFLFQAIVEFAGDALAFFERGLFDNPAFESGDLAALLSDPEQAERNDGTQNADGNDKALGIPKRCFAEDANIRDRTQEQRGAIWLGTEAFVSAGRFDEADAGECAGRAEFKVRCV